MSLSTSRAIAPKVIWPLFARVGKEESTLGNVRTGRVNRTGSGREAVKTNRMLPMTGPANEVLKPRCGLGSETCVSVFARVKVLDLFTPSTSRSKKQHKRR